MSNIKDLAKIVADRYDMHQHEAESFLDDMFSLIRSTLINDEQVKIKGLGTFKVQTVKERASVNVNTGEKVVINSHDRITFTPDASMRDSVNKPFAHFVTVPLNEGVVFDDMDDMAKVPETVRQRELDNEPEAEREVDGQDSPNNMPLPQQHVPEANSDAPSVIASSGTSVAPPLGVGIGQRNDEAEPLQSLLHREQSAEEQMSHEDETHVAHTVVTDDGSVPVPSVGEVDTPAEDIQQPAESPDCDKSPTGVDEPQDTEDNTIHNQEEITTTAMSDEMNINPSVAEENNHSFLISLLLGLAVFVIGVIVGRATADITIQDVKEYLGLKPEVKVHVVYKRLPAPAQEKKDTTARDKGVKPATAKAPAPAVHRAETKKGDETNAVKKAEGKKADALSATNENYNKDPRVRTGAYVITGVQQTVTATEGETVASISKKYLGPGMECYVEALNGKTITAGQKVKIPALRLKKKASVH
ncbi:MAG: HU family DNA-binding protein [Prevotella sp.]